LIITAPGLPAAAATAGLNVSTEHRDALGA
jgi:hypothetical protein